MSRSNASLKLPARATLLVDFTDGTHTLTAVGGGGDVQYDTVSPSATGRSYALGSNGIEISYTSATANQYASVKYEPGTVMDFSGVDSVWVECYIPEGGSTFAGQEFANVTILLTEQSGTTYTNNISRNHGGGSVKASRVQLLGSNFTTGWTLSGGGPTGWPGNMRTIRKIDIRLAANASAAYGAKIFVRKIWAGRSRPTVILSWDDAWSAQYTNAFSVMQAAGLKGVIFPHTGVIGTGGRLTVAQIKEMYLAGWDVGGHGSDHDADVFCLAAGDNTGLTRSSTTATFTSNVPHYFSGGESVTVIGAADPAWNTTFTNISVSNSTTFTFTCAGTEQTPARGTIRARKALTNAQIKAIIQADQAYWNALGMTRGRNVWAYMNGNTTEEIAGILNECGIVLSRTTSTNGSPGAACMDPRVSMPLGNLTLAARTMDNNTAATCLGYVDVLQKQGGTLWLYGHDQQASAASNAMATSEFNILINGSATLAGLVDRKDSGLIDVLSATEYLARFGAAARSA